MFYADFPPKVGRPSKVGNHHVARYFLEWRSPHVNIETVKMEIDATDGKPLTISLNSLDLMKPDPEVADKPPPELHEHMISMPPAITNRSDLDNMVRRAIPKINDLIALLQLDCAPAAITSNIVINARVEPPGFAGNIVLQNGYNFGFFGDDRSVTVSDFWAPDQFFDAGHEIRVRNFLGKRKLTERQGLTIAEKALLKVNPKLRFTQKPKTIRPYLPPDIIVPRCLFNWSLDSAYIYAEVDLESGAVKSLSAY